MLEAVNSIKGDLLSQSRRIGETEERILHVEEDVTALQQKVKQLEGTTEMLRNKIQDQEDRARRSNLRLIGLPEKTEGPDVQFSGKLASQATWRNSDPQPCD